MMAPITAPAPTFFAVFVVRLLPWRRYGSASTPYNLPPTEIESSSRTSSDCPANFPALFTSTTWPFKSYPEGTATSPSDGRGASSVARKVCPGWAFSEINWIKQPNRHGCSRWHRNFSRRRWRRWLRRRCGLCCRGRSSVFVRGCVVCLRGPWCGCRHLRGIRLRPMSMTRRARTTFDRGRHSQGPGGRWLRHRLLSHLVRGTGCRCRRSLQIVHHFLDAGVVDA